MFLKETCDFTDLDYVTERRNTNYNLVLAEPV